MMLIKSPRWRRSAALAVALAAALAPAVLSPPGAAAAPSATTLIDYHGLRLTVPAAWTVVDLAANPTACVRFDVHAVYLGHAPAAQQCPAGRRGHTEALQLEPLDGSTATATVDRPGTSVAAPGTAAYVPAKFAVPGEVRFAVPAAGVSATATFGTPGARAAVENVLRTAALAPGATAQPPTSPARRSWRPRPRARSPAGTSAGASIRAPRRAPVR